MRASPPNQQKTREQQGFNKKERTMKKRSWTVRVQRALVLVSMGAAVLGTTCARDIRKSLVAAGLDFVEGSAGIVLENLFPIEDALAQE